MATIVKSFKGHVSKVGKIAFVNILDVRHGRNVKSRWLQVLEPEQLENLEGHLLRQGRQVGIRA